MTGPEPLVTDDVLDTWRTAVHAWLAADPVAQGPSAHAADALAAWLDALRIAGGERGWRGPGAAAVLDDAVLVGIVVVPLVVDRVGANPLDRFAVAVLRLALALGPDPTDAAERGTDGPRGLPDGSGDPSVAARRAVRLGLAALVGSRPEARDAVRRWAGAALPDLGRDVLALLDEVDGSDDAGLRAEGSAVAAAFGPPAAAAGPDASDGGVSDLAAELVVAAWRAAEAARATVRAILARALTVVEDRFLVELEVDGEPISYVQGIVEERRVLTVEVAHGTFVGRPLTDEREALLLADGWNRPEEGLPNPWRTVDLDDLGADGVADLLVRAMDLCHAPFDGLPADAAIRVEPLAVAEAAVPDDATLLAVHGTGGPLDGPVPWADRPVELVPAGVLAALTDALASAVADVGTARDRAQLLEAVALVVVAGAAAIRRALAVGGQAAGTALDALDALDAVAMRVLPGLPDAAPRAPRHRAHP